MMVKGQVPPGGWNARTFRQFGTVLITDFVRVHRYSRRRREKATAEKVLAFMQGQLARVVAAPTSSGKSAKAGEGFVLNLDLPGPEAFWLAILADIFGDREDIELEAIMLPELQALVAMGANKTGALLGVVVANEVARVTLPTIANRMAQQVTQINQTTRNQIREVLAGEIAKGSTVRATIDVLKEKMGPKIEARAATIARTELNNAYTQGSIQTFLASPTLTHVSVVGCEGTNDSNNYFEGRHTCNIKMVPKEKAPLLTWHPNHTGTMVPAAFTP